MKTDHKQKPTLQCPASPIGIVGTILAIGVIRMLEGKDLLDKLTEERVHTGVLTTQENPLD
jgi:hypothetical protein